MFPARTLAAFCLPRRAPAAVVAGVLLLAACDGPRDQARDAYFEGLRLSKTGGPAEEQLAAIDRAIALDPSAAAYPEWRAGLLVFLGRYADARRDYDRAVALADRPYLRFARAQALCALGEVDAALADLDRAIAAQPENDQFYPRRALARLAAGRVPEARADLENARARQPSYPEESYALAAVLFSEGRYGDAVAVLDRVVAAMGDSGGMQARVLRMLAHEADGRRELAAAEFDTGRIAAGAQGYDRGPQVWLGSRGCENAFLVMRHADLVEQVRGMIAALEATRSARASRPSSPAPVAPADPGKDPSAAVEPAMPRQPTPEEVEASRYRRIGIPVYRVVEVAPGRVRVDLDLMGPQAASAAPEALQLLDARGVRRATRVAVHRICESVCGDPGDRKCHVVGEYRHDGPVADSFTVALGVDVVVKPQAVELGTPARAAQLEHMARLFPATPPDRAEPDVSLTWRRPDPAGDWEERAASYATLFQGRRGVLLQDTGTRFADCTLRVEGPLTEFACPRRRTVYLGARFVGGHDDPRMNALVRYAAELGGMPLYVVAVSGNSVEQVRLLFRIGDTWWEDGVPDDHVPC